jgi:hypothetical protein
VPNERALESRNARSMLGLYLARIDVANGGRDAAVVGDALDFTQIARRTIEGAEHTRANRGEREMWQAVTANKLAANRLGEGGREAVDTAYGASE